MWTTLEKTFAETKLTEKNHGEFDFGADQFGALNTTVYCTCTTTTAVLCELLVRTCFSIRTASTDDFRYQYCEICNSSTHIIQKN